MPKSHRPYPPAFRQRIIELVRKGRTPEELGRQFEPSAQAIRNWVRQADRDDGRRQDGLTTVEQDELRRLRLRDQAGYSDVITCRSLRPVCCSITSAPDTPCRARRAGRAGR